MDAVTEPCCKGGGQVKKFCPERLMEIGGFLKVLEDFLYRIAGVIYI